MGEAALDIVEELKELNARGITYTEIANRSAVNRAHISKAVNGHEPLTPEYEAAVRKVVSGIRAKEAETDNNAVPIRQYKTSVERYKTLDWRRATGWCDYVVKKRKMGVMIGPPGSGKTTVLEDFAVKTPGLVRIRALRQMRVRDLLAAIADGIGAEISGPNYPAIVKLTDALRGRPDVVIAVDEAEHLARWDVDKFEILRDIWDETRTPVILAGTERLEDILTRGLTRRDNLAQLYRRKIEIMMAGVTVAEARDILAGYNVSRPARDTLAAIAADFKHGGLGMFSETLEMCLEYAKGGEITDETLKSAANYKLSYRGE
jgi:DNA transposition AAA+ family ATPase